MFCLFIHANYMDFDVISAFFHIVLWANNMLYIIVYYMYALFDSSVKMPRMKN
jgi:hypothetical protein